jgi:alanyl-tRNA synthetase
MKSKKFSQTLSSGMAILEDEISKLKGKQISGEVAFKLYDTYGFPLDLTADIARERDLSIDNKGFDKAMAKQQEMARKSGNFKATNTLLIDKTSDFKGYEDLTTTSEVVAIIQDNKEVNNIKDNAGIIILDNTPFYAESGGQTGDIGELKMGDNIFNVSDTQKQKTGAFEHYGTINGELKVGDKVVATVDTKNRENIAKNHSATHLLHAALKEILGENVNQKGSLVDSEKIAF